MNETKKSDEKLMMVASAPGWYSSGAAAIHGKRTPQKFENFVENPFSMQLYLMTMEKTGIDDKIATTC